MDRDKKNELSHRGKATRAMIDHFVKKINTKTSEEKKSD